MAEILVSQELVQVEYATRSPGVVVAHELLQVEYIPMDKGTGNMGAIINGIGNSIPEYAYVESKHVFEYFDVQVDFTLSSGIESSLCGVEIVFEINSDNRFYIRSGNYSSQQSFMCDFREDGISHCYTVSGTNDYGKFRVSRRFGQAKVYYKDGDDVTWSEFATYNSFPNGKGNILLGFYSSNDARPGASLDNFKTNLEYGCDDCYFFDSFHGNNGDMYNQDLWNGSTSNICIYNNMLHMTYNNDYTYVDTNCCHIIGDFNVQVDFSIGNYQSSSYWAVYLRVYFENGDNIYIRYQYTSPHHKYTTDSYIGGVWGGSVYYESDIMLGKFRITKVGKYVSSYFLLDSKWYCLGEYELLEDTGVSYIKLYKASETNLPKVECYFNNFIVNSCMGYNDIVAGGTYTTVDGNYVKLDGGYIHTNRHLDSSNTLTIETTITFYNNNVSYGPGLFVALKPYLQNTLENSYSNICIFDRNGSLSLNIDGNIYSYISRGVDGSGYSNLLFSIEFGKPYVIGVKFIPGTGTIIYWQGPENGHLLIDYMMNGDIYAWAGTVFGNKNYNDYISKVHMFRCFEENIPYKELINNWEQSIGYNDSFTGVDGRQPNYSRWNVTGDPRIYNNSLKLITNDKIQLRGFLCTRFEVILDYNNLSFDSVSDNYLSLNIEAYDMYRDKIIGTSKFKVGYNGGSGVWVSYYCSGSSGNSSIFHALLVDNRQLRIVNDGYKITYYVSGANDWVIVHSQECVKQYYYRVSIEGIGDNTVFYVDSISFDGGEFLDPTDATCLVPTGWKFSPTDKAYQCASYIPLNEIIDRCRHFSVDCVAKIDDSLFLTYFEADKDLVIFNGAIVVGDNYQTLTSAVDAAEDGQVIYVLPGSYQFGGYTVTKKVLIVGVGEYSSINIIISSNSVILNSCDVTFKNLTILEQMPYNTYSFKVQGFSNSYITMDNCKYIAPSNNYVDIFKIETASLFVYMRKCYIVNLNSNSFATSEVSGHYIVVDILNCRINLSLSNLFYSDNYYRMRSTIFANISRYEPIITNSIPIFTLFSPENEKCIYLNTPNGVEKKITCNEDQFNYLSYGSSPGGAIFFGAKNNYHYSDYLMPPIGEDSKLFIQGYVDTIRVFNNYQTYGETLNNISKVNDLGLTLKLAHNDHIVDYKIYEPLNLYNSSLYLGQGTHSIVDEFIWSRAKTNSSTMLGYYTSYLDKLGYETCNIYVDSIKYKFFMDFGSPIGVGTFIQSVPHNFTNTVYYSDDTDNPALLSNPCSLSEARWYSLYNTVTANATPLTLGKLSMFPAVDGCDQSRWKYTGERGYVDTLPGSVLTVDSSVTDVYNIVWKRDKISMDEHLISVISESVTISMKLFGGGICNRIEIKSGCTVGTEFAGYITKCHILIDNVQQFSIDNNINSKIVAEFDSLSFVNIDIVIEEVKQVPRFYFDGINLTGDTVFVNYIKVLSVSSNSIFSDTLCNVYEFDSSIKLDSIITEKDGTCSLDYYYGEQYVNGCVNTEILDFDNLPSNSVLSIFAKSDNLYNCGFLVDKYVVGILSETMTGSIESWKVYLGDVELYEELFYIQGTSSSIGLRFFKETEFEVGTYCESFGTYSEWAVTDELVLNIYASKNITDFYLCIGDKIAGRYYRWAFSLSEGWNSLRFNFYDSKVTKYVFNVMTNFLLFSDLVISNVWCGGVYQHDEGFVVLDNIFIDEASLPNTLSSHKDAFYLPLTFESDSGCIEMSYMSYWDSGGVIFGNILSDKVILSLFCDELCLSVINKTDGEFVLGVYSYKFAVRTVKRFGYALKFNVNDVINLKLDWSCYGGQFISNLYINGMFVGKVTFSLIETSIAKVTGIMVGGGSVYITSIYNSLSLCGQVKHLKVYSSDKASLLINDKLFIDNKNLVTNSPLYVGEIEPSNYVELPVRYEGKSKKLNEINLHMKWVGIY